MIGADIHGQLWRMLIDEDAPIGSGVSRTVYPVLGREGLVAKVDNRGKSFHNAIEWETWNAVKDTEFARWFAPCVDISGNGAVLIQHRTTPAKPHQYPRQMPVFLNDFKRANYGMLGKRLVAHDYGLLNTAGFSSRMQLVRWWTPSDDGPIYHPHAARRP